MSVAYQYGGCYWNASGEFECLTNNQTVSKAVLEDSIKYSPQIMPENRRNYVQPNCNYAKVPVNRKDLDRQVIEAYNSGSQNTGSQNTGGRDTGGQCRQPRERTHDKHSPRHKMLAERIDGRTGDFSPLNREMEISIYLPERDEQFPWDRDERKKKSQIDNSSDFFRIDPNKIKHLPPPIIIPPNDHQPGMLPKENLPKENLPKGNLPKLTASSMEQPQQTPMWSQVSKFFGKFKKKVNKYYFQMPYQKYDDLVEEIGPPTLINPNKGGMAVWQASALKKAGHHSIKRIDLIDEQRFNNFPYPHIGFLYVYVRLNIPLNKIANVLSMCGDIMYDPVKQLLVVRGMSLNYNIALIAIVCQYANGELTWYNIIEGDVIKKATDHKQLTNKKTQKKNMATLNRHLIK
jgi:hypothetical protein